MPLTGKPEHDIPTEIQAGKPRKQAIAIALSKEREMGKSRDDLQPVGEDPKRDAAIAAHNAGETKSQDIEPVGDTYASEVSADLKRAQAVLAENKKLQQEMSGKRGKAKDGIYRAAADKLYNDMRAASKDLNAVKDKLTTSLGLTSNMGLTPDAVKKHPEFQSAQQAYQKANAAMKSFMKTNGKAVRAEENSERGRDAELAPVGDRSKSEVEGELKRAEETLADHKKKFKNFEGTPRWRALYDRVQSLKKELGQAKDADPTPIKTTNLETMPDGPSGNATYAKDAAGGGARLTQINKEYTKLSAQMDKLTDKLIAEGHGNVRHSELSKLDSPTAKEKLQISGKLASLRAEGERIYGPGYNPGSSVMRVGGTTRAKDKGKAKDTAMQHAGSEPQDHLIRGMQYEVGQDKARALDSYRAAATGFRHANDAREVQARDGITACQRSITASYDGQYFHPNAGRTRVCDSADAALRTALERTRAGEVVSVDGTTVRPGVARAKDEATLPAAVADEHEGFKKLEGKLAREKGVKDPAAVAAAIGRRKYGESGMAAKSAAGRAKDSREILPV